MSAESQLPTSQSIILDVYASTYAQIVRDLFADAIIPARDDMAARLAMLPAKGTNAQMDRYEQARTVQMELHRSFALGLGALWERNFREHLRQSAYVIGAKPLCPKLMAKIDGSGWDGMEQAFEDLRGFPLSWFPMYPTLA